MAKAKANPPSATLSDAIPADREAQITLREALRQRGFLVDERMFRSHLNGSARNFRRNLLESITDILLESGTITAEQAATVREELSASAKAWAEERGEQYNEHVRQLRLFLDEANIKQPVLLEKLQPVIPDISSQNLKEYLSGKNSFPQEVFEAIITLLKNEYKLTDVEAEEFRQQFTTAAQRGSEGLSRPTAASFLVKFIEKIPEEKQETFKAFMSRYAGVEAGTLNAWLRAEPIPDTKIDLFMEVFSNPEVLRMSPALTEIKDVERKLDDIIGILTNAKVARVADADAKDFKAAAIREVYGLSIEEEERYRAILDDPASVPSFVDLVAQLKGREQDWARIRNHLIKVAGFRSDECERLGAEEERINVLSLRRLTADLVTEILPSSDEAIELKIKAAIQQRKKDKGWEDTPAAEAQEHLAAELGVPVEYIVAAENIAALTPSAFYNLAQALSPDTGIVPADVIKGRDVVTVKEALRQREGDKRRTGMPATQIQAQLAAELGIPEEHIMAVQAIGSLNLQIYNGLIKALNPDAAAAARFKYEAPMTAEEAVAFKMAAIQHNLQVSAKKRENLRVAAAGARAGEEGTAGDVRAARRRWASGSQRPTILGRRRPVTVTQVDEGAADIEHTTVPGGSETVAGGTAATGDETTGPAAARDGTVKPVPAQGEPEPAPDATTMEGCRDIWQRAVRLRDESAALMGGRILYAFNDVLTGGKFDMPIERIAEIPGKLLADCRDPRKRTGAVTQIIQVVAAAYPGEDLLTQEDILKALGIHRLSRGGGSRGEGRG